ncbi:putative calcium-binding protein, partial [Xenococcus sp. PCC 7305]|uniref:calcium-binding protein n=1 Tax=Xenococcus sp. PCC 7305 TaxID=102125 RepID=UPI0002ABAB9E
MTTFIVNNNNDSGVGSLRQAIADANAAIGSDTIEFDNSLSGQQITLTSGELQITDDLTINGLGADLLTVSGNNTDRVFLIDDEDGDIAIDVAFNGLTITQGNSDEGGGIRNRENLILTNSNIANNTGTGISNGGYSINSGSDLTVTNSSVTNNSSTGISHSYGSLAIRNSIVSDNLGWGIGSGNSGTEITQSTISGNGNGGIASGMTVLIMTDSAITDNTGSGFVGNRVNFEIDNSVISENTTTDSGGGIAGSYYFSGSISNSKITNNIADSDGDGDGNGGGVAGVPADILFTNTIIAGNFDNSPAGSEQYPDISGPGFGSNGYNFVGDVTGIRSYNPFTETGDLFGTSANPLSLSQIIEGTPGNDYLEGTAGMDRIAGGNGNDTLRGRGGIDVLLGEAGHDRLFGDGGENTLSGGVG